MAVLRERAQVVNIDGDQPRFARAPDDAVVERPAEEIGEDGQDVDDQLCSRC